MKYYSINKQASPVDFKEATIKGLAPDKGLYFPEHIPQVDAAFIKQIENYSNAEIAYLYYNISFLLVTQRLCVFVVQK